jgi:hypothetical protein
VSQISKMDVERKRMRGQLSARGRSHHRISGGIHALVCSSKIGPFSSEVGPSNDLVQVGPARAKCGPLDEIERMRVACEARGWLI